LTTEYAQERLQRRNKLVSSYLDQFKKSPFVKLSRLSSNDVAKVMSAGSIKRAQILAEKRATPQRLPVLDKTHSTTSGSVIFREEEDSGYVSSSPTETTRSMEDITKKIVLVHTPSIPSIERIEGPLTQWGTQVQFVPSFQKE
jgi:hypothetical protein